MTKTEIIIELDHQRSAIGGIDQDIVELKAQMPECGVYGQDMGEALANITIAHRCLEDARMRLGKVIQSLEGGVSILDHPEVKALIEKIRADG